MVVRMSPDCGTLWYKPGPMPLRRPRAAPPTNAPPIATPAGCPLAAPIEPMLAKLTEELPPAGAIAFEPKWDGFRAIVFRGDEGIYIQSRDLRPLDRYFPELSEALRHILPARCVLDGEIVIATDHGLDFDALQLRLHPAASRVAKP